MNNPNKFTSARSILNRSALVIAALLAAGPLLAQNQPTEKPKTERAPHSTATFVREFAEGNLAEIQMGKLAEQKSQNAQVKQFAERLVTDHGKANDQLKALAQKGEIKFPTEPNRAQRHQLSKLEKLSGSKFDQEFARFTIRDHARDINKYQHVADTTKDPALKEYAESTLPTLKEHLKMAEDTGRAVGLSPETISSLEKRHHAMDSPGTSTGAEKGQSEY